MRDGLDVIIVDDDTSVCKVILEIIKGFYTWGNVLAFTSNEEAAEYCKRIDAGIAIFILDVFMERGTGFTFLEGISDKFPMAYEDTIIITGRADSDIVNMCIASKISYLIEKPIRPYTLQLAVRAIVTKYIEFARRLLQDSALAESIAGI